MNRIFISHSSRDAQQAEMVLTWLKREGIEAFLDSDKELGIKAGADWHEELKLRLEECSVLIPICSHHFRESDWCRYEVDVAYYRAMDIIPILIDDSLLIGILKRYQAINYCKSPEGARDRLLSGLKPILEAHRPVDWDPKRTPYPGLDPFMEADEAIFFGRQREINEGVQTLRSLRRERDAALMMVIGASGSGKSSLVRAGILPRMKRDTEEWIVLDPFRPGQDPYRELANSIANLFEAYAETKSRSEMLHALQVAPVEALGNFLADLCILTKKNEAILLICIDQFEELLEVSSSKTSPGSISQRQAFLGFLQHVLDVQASRDRFLVIGTIRSDFLDVFQSSSFLQGVKYKEFILRPMDEANFRQVIEEPARIAGLKIEPRLVDTMIKDTKTGDALPLLAFTLRELWERKIREPTVGFQSPSLNQSDYSAMGGLEGAIQKTAEDIFTTYCPKTQENKCRDAFLRMIRSNVDLDQVGWVKRSVLWTDMPTESLETLGHFVTARLLVKKSVDEQVLIEPAHEALLRNWARLREWIKEENDFLLWRDRFNVDFKQWRNSQSRIKDYLVGAKLIEAERWKTKFAVSSQERLFIDKSIRLRRRLWQVRIAIVMALIFGLIRSLQLWQDAEEAQAEQLKIRQLSSVNSDPFGSGITGLAAMGRFFLIPGLNFQIARGLEQALANNLARTEKLATSLSRIDAITVVSDTRLVVAGTQGPSAYLLDINIDSDGALTLQSQPQKTDQTTIRQLMHLKDQSKIYSLGFSDEYNLLTTWPKGEQQVLFKSQQIDPQTLAFLPGPEPIVAAYGERDGLLYIWSNGEVVQSLSGVPRTTAFTTLKDGTVISAHDSGPLRQWKVTSNNGKPHVVEVGKLNNSGTILSLTSFISDGHTIIVAGADDGSLRVWVDGKDGPKIDPKLSGQGQIISLASLPSGDVISGDNQSLTRWWKWQGQQAGLQPRMKQPFNTGQGAIKGLTALSKSTDSSPNFISTGTDGSLRLLSYRPNPLITPMPVSADPTQAEVTGLVDLGQGLLASSHLNGTVCWWDLPRQLPDEILPDCKQSMPAKTIPTALEASAGDAPLVASGSDGILYTWNRNRQLNPLKPKEENALSPITAMIAAGESVVISGHEDGSLRWQDVHGQPVSQRPVDSGYAPVEKLLPLGRNLFVSAGGPPGAERLRWWRGGTPQTSEGVPFPHDRLTSMVRWTGNQIVTAGSEGSIQLWTNGKRDGDLLKTDHKTGVWSLIALRGNLLHGPTLMLGGDEGIIRLFRSDFRGSTSDSQPDHESFETGQARIMQMMEDSRGDLISGSEDGTIKVLSPRRIVKATCDLYQPLLHRPTNASEQEAAQLCACQVPEQWWNVWGWVCFTWGMLT